MIIYQLVKDTDLLRELLNKKIIKIIRQLNINDYNTFEDNCKTLYADGTLELTLENQKIYSFCSDTENQSIAFIKGYFNDFDDQYYVKLDLSKEIFWNKFINQKIIQLNVLIVNKVKFGLEFVFDSNVYWLEYISNEEYCDLMRIMEPYKIDGLKRMSI